MSGGHFHRTTAVVWPFPGAICTVPLLERPQTVHFASYASDHTTAKLHLCILTVDITDVAHTCQYTYISQDTFWRCRLALMILCWRVGLLLGGNEFTFAGLRNPAILNSSTKDLSWII